MVCESVHFLLNSINLQPLLVTAALEPPFLYTGFRLLKNLDMEK